MKYTYINRTEWQYWYNPMGEREQKRLYYAPGQDFAGNAYAWLYYQLGLDNKQHAVYHGVQISDDIIIKDDTLLQYDNNPFDCSVFLYPTEYNSYGAGSSLSIQYKLDYTGNWRKDFLIYDHLGSVRAVLRDTSDDEYPSYIIKAQYDYEPFGEVLYHNDGSRSRNTFIGKEKDWETMIDQYRAGLADHGVRKYEDFSGRFTSPDPLWEKYYGWSPYVYSANNPLSFVDPNGMELTVTGTNTALLKFNDEVQQGTGGMYETQIDNNGQVLLKETGMQGPLSSEQQAFYDQMKETTDLSKPNTSINISESNQTLIGSYGNNEIDIDDIKNIGLGQGLNSSSAFIHEITEQTIKQVNGLQNTMNDYQQAHLKGVATENSVSGATRLDILYPAGTSIMNPTTGTGFMDFKYSLDNQTINVRLNINSNNVIGVTRR